MKKSNVLFLAGALTILAILIFSSAIVWALITESKKTPWPHAEQRVEKPIVEIKEVPVKVIVHDTVKIKIQCNRQHLETKKDTVY